MQRHFGDTFYVVQPVDVNMVQISGGIMDWRGASDNNILILCRLGSFWRLM